MLQPGYEPVAQLQYSDGLNRSAKGPNFRDNCNSGRIISQLMKLPEMCQKVEKSKAGELLLLSSNQTWAMNGIEMRIRGQTVLAVDLLQWRRGFKSWLRCTDEDSKHTKHPML